MNTRVDTRASAGHTRGAPGSRSKSHEASHARRRGGGSPESGNQSSTRQYGEDRRPRAADGGRVPRAARKNERGLAAHYFIRQLTQTLRESARLWRAKGPHATGYKAAQRMATVIERPTAIAREEVELPNESERRRGGFAFVLHDVFSPAECAEMIAASEARGYDQALVNAGYAQLLDTSTRNSMRNIWDNPETAAEIHSRVAPHLPNETEPHSFGYSCSPQLLRCAGLNERLRFLRYDAGDFFAAHQDGSYERPDRSSRSYLTLMLYLNSGGGVDFTGGETSFVSQSGANTDVAFVPRAGDVLIFTHPVLHQGNEVTRGRKYAVRTDVMYAEV